MNGSRFRELAVRYGRLRIALVGDFCLDRYLEIDPSREETSIETGLPVHNVTQVRAQPGGAGTVLNNLVALGVGQIHLVGFCGDDGEGYELKRALAGLPGGRMDHFLTVSDRRTFTYCKPLVISPGAAPRELNRLDSKNWTPTPPHIEEQLIASLETLATQVDAVIVMDQVDHAETGVVTSGVLKALTRLPDTLPVIADSRRGLLDYPPVIFKMNVAELAVMIEQHELQHLEAIQEAAIQLARRNERTVIVTLSERGLIGALPDGHVMHVPALPVRGAIDIVGAGDCVTANVIAALASGASLDDALQIAAAASSIVLHQVGTTGSASVEQIAGLLDGE